MTVAEVIQALQTFPANSICVVNLTKNELANGGEVERIELVGAVKKDWKDVWDTDYFPQFSEEDEVKGQVVNISA